MSAKGRPSELTAHLGFWMRIVSNHVSQAFANKLAVKDVTVAEWVMMRALYGHAPMAPSHVADIMGMTRGAITKLADRLIQKSLVVRKANRDDGRAQTLELTARATTLVPELAALADRNDAEVFDHLTSSDRKTLERILKHLVERCEMDGMPVE